MKRPPVQPTRYTLPPGWKDISEVLYEELFKDEIPSEEKENQEDDEK